MKIKIDGEMLEVTDVINYSYVSLLELEDGTEYFVSESSEDAGKAAREIWEVSESIFEFATMFGLWTIDFRNKFYVAK